MGTQRRATHAGSWYSASGSKLAAELESWLSDVQLDSANIFTPPITGCKAIIAPHAGYSYSGPTAAWAYKSIDTSGISRVLILGPSHHVYLDGCALSGCDSYETPVGNLPLDLATIKDLEDTGLFSKMSRSTDEDEHSIEMHLPYIRQTFAGKDIKVVPILVGAIDKEKEKVYGAILAPYLASTDTLAVISSDFCHWGTRFSYTFYYPTPLPCPNPVRLGKAAATLSSSLKAHPIHRSIRALDHEALEILQMDGSMPDKKASEAHEDFASYLSRTKNTICGRHPIGVLLGALAALETADKEKYQPSLKWVRYAQSSECVDVRDSSVSYASAFISF